MEIEEVQAELQSLWKLYALHRQIGDATGTTELSAPYLDERALTLFKDLLDRRWETTLRTYSQLITTAQPNEPPPPPSPVPKIQCKYCHQRSLKRQTSITQDSETKHLRDSAKDSKFMEEVVHLIHVPETSRKPKQLFVREARSVPSSASNSSGRWIRKHRRKWESEDSERFSSGSSHSSWPIQAETRPGRRSSSYSYSISDASESCSYTRSVRSYTDNFSSYSIEKPALVRNPVVRAGPARRRRGRARGDVIETVKKITKKLGQVFHHEHDHEHRHHNGGGNSMWGKAKELLFHQNKRNRPPAVSEQKAKKNNKKKRLHWWQLKRRTEEPRRKKKR